MYRHTCHGNLKFLKNFKKIGCSWFLWASYFIGRPVIFVLYLKKLNHKGRMQLLWPFRLVCGPRGNGRPSASPGGKSREEFHAAFFPEHLLTTSAALTCYVSLCVPQSPVMRAHRTTMVSVSGKNVHLSHELLTNFKANSTTLILGGNKHTAMAALRETFYAFRFSENSHFFLMAISSVPFLPSQW